MALEASQSQNTKSFTPVLLSFVISGKSSVFHQTHILITSYHAVVEISRLYHLALRKQSTIKGRACQQMKVTV